MTEDLTRTPVRVLVLGRPGAGKGTQGVRLARLLGVPHLSTGELLRAEIDRDGPIGREIAAHVERGRLVPDDLVATALRRRLAADDATAGFVLDGYPRSIAQAVALERMVAPGRITAAIELVVAEREAEQRLLARFVCADCGQPAAEHDPAAETLTCARCGGPLRRRADDDAAIVRRRFVEFERCTKPLLEWLDRRRILVGVDAERPPDVVTAAVRSALAPALHAAGAAGFRAPEPAT